MTLSQWRDSAESSVVFLFLSLFFFFLRKRKVTSFILCFNVYPDVEQSRFTCVVLYVFYALCFSDNTGCAFFFFFSSPLPPLKSFNEDEFSNRWKKKKAFVTLVMFLFLYWTWYTVCILYNFVLWRMSFFVIFNKQSIECLKTVSNQSPASPVELACCMRTYKFYKFCPCPSSHTLGKMVYRTFCLPNTRWRCALFQHVNVYLSDFSCQCIVNIQHPQQS